MGGIAENHTGDIQVEELDGISNLDQAERIAQHYANVSSEYKALGNDDIPRSEYSTEELPPFVEAYEMYDRIKKMSSKKATVKDDIPMAIIKEFAAELSEPLAHILNFGLTKALYSKLWRFETITPVPEVYPPENIQQLRKISGTKNFAKICDSFLIRSNTEI